MALRRGGFAGQLSVMNDLIQAERGLPLLVIATTWFAARKLN